MPSKAERLLDKSQRIAKHGDLAPWQETLSPTARRRLARKEADAARKAQASEGETTRPR